MPVGVPSVSPLAVRRALRDRAEIGLLDVRSERRFATGHPLFAASFPLGRLEAEVFDRLPRRSVPLVVYGDGPGAGSGKSAADAATAVRKLRSLGYRDVSLLACGLTGWTAAGGELFADVNTPSKAFGELVAATAGTPDVTARDLQAMLRDGQDVVVVDARRFEEYQTMSIPTATSVPGAELILRVGALAPDPATTVVVNCAGRTRSIIGTQSLINAGQANRVMALRNGTIGWTLAGLPLDHRQARRAPEVRAAAARRAQAAAWAVASQAGVRQIGSGELRALADGGRRTVYRFDVRTPEEYAAGHPAGFRSAPGGQLVQETDWFAPVRGALVVLADDHGGRAAMTGSWLAQMGWDVALWLPDPAGSAETGPWRPVLPPLPLSAGPGEMPSLPVDVYRRPYEGTDVDPAVMQAYLDWEHGLVAQLERDGTHGFTVLTGPGPLGHPTSNCLLNRAIISDIVTQ
jgi:rhodanese-related sulfurtransferase